MNLAISDAPCGPRPRHATVGVRVGEGDAAVTVGGGAPIVVQSMTNTDTADVEATARQVAALCARGLRTGAHHGRSRRGRRRRAAYPRSRSASAASVSPLIGDFHYIGHKLLSDHPACAEALDKYRINPGNVGFKNKRDLQFGKIIEIAISNGKPVRIGANWGSLDQELLTSLMDENAASAAPLEAGAVTREAMVRSALLSAARAEEIGLPARAHHPVGESLVGAGPHHRLPDARRALRLRAPSRPDRSRHGLEGHRRLRRRARRPPAGRPWRHDPHFAHPRAGRRPDAGSAGGAGAAADDGVPQFRAAGRRLSRLRAHHLDRVPGAGARHPGLSRHSRCRNGARSIPASKSSTSR